MKISLIAAMSKNRVIGRGNKLPWNIPEDLKYFRDKTNGRVLIMGRKTFDSVGRPLPNRETRVITRSKDLEIPGAKTFPSLKRAIDDLRLKGSDYPIDEIFISGGGEIYKLALPIVDRIYLTIIDQEVEDGDAFFPEFSRSDFEEISKDSRSGSPAFTFYVYDRKMY